jgi:regulator of protease activity HflC (stomatin/prohibitin superfamily)
MTTARQTLNAAQAYLSSRPPPEREQLDRALRVAVMLGTTGLVTVSALALGAAIGGPALAPIIGVASFPVALLLGVWLSAITRVAAQWERVVVLRLGRFHSIKGPGLLFVFPVVDHARFVDTRLLTVGIPSQQVITRDNVPVGIDGVVFFQVRDVEKAVVTVQDYRSAMLQYAQASLRDVVGSMSLDELLSERDEIQTKIATAVESRSAAWGIHVDSIRLLDINMPEELKRMMSRQASADREKRATIIKAEGDKEAAKNLAEAAETMTASPGAMQLRTLQTLDGLGASASNTVVLAVPIEVIELAQRLAKR